MNNQRDERPWGYFECIKEDKNFKIKRIVVFPEKRTSLQRHKFRSEHWYVIEGEATVLVEDKIVTLKKGESITFDKMQWHRLENRDKKLNTMIIEVQTGTYFGEDDIERIEDDFGRAGNIEKC